MINWGCVGGVNGELGTTKLVSVPDGNVKLRVMLPIRAICTDQYHHILLRGLSMTGDR